MQAFEGRTAVVTGAASGVDPTANGATVQVYAASGDGDAVCLALPRDGWTASGDPTRPRYRYRDPQALHGPCSTASLRPALLRVTCAARRSPIAYSLDEPSQGAVAVRVASGATTWCMVFGGRVRRDSGTDPPNPGGHGRFSAVDAPAPAACPPEPAACP